MSSLRANSTEPVPAARPELVDPVALELVLVFATNTVELASRTVIDPLMLVPDGEVMLNEVNE